VNIGTVLYFNATSLENKMDEFRILCKTENTDVVGVSETWFKITSSSQVDDLNLYKKARNDGRRGGGVAIYVNSKLNSYEFIDSCFMKSRMEQMWVVISILSEKYLVGCIYKPPDFTDMQDFGEVFRKIKDYADRKCFKDILIMGDINYPEVVWTNGIISMINSESSNVRKFCGIVNKSFLIQHVCSPTFQMANGTTENTLDLIFTTEESNFFELLDIGILGEIRKAHLIIKFKWCLNKRKELCLR